MEVPSGGVPLTPVTADDVAANQDEKAPGNFNLDTIQNQINEWNGTDTKRSGGKAGPSGAKASKGAKALFSKGVSASTKGRAVDVDVDITGAKQLYLVVGDGGDGFGCDWADWIEPRLVAADGSETKLTDLKWKSASAGFGEVHINKRVDGGPLKVEGDDTPIGYGIGTHANSIIAYDLPAGHKFTKFKARGAVDEGGTSQGCGSTVEFMVFNAAPSVGAISSTAGVAGHDPDEATNTLDVHPDLQVDLFAAEPMLLSPSNTDIDHLGRVWVCEIVNYRRHNGERKEGDRILILEDSDHDGHADKETVFYQGPEVNSAHGVCVLATPDLKGTQAIVSCGDKVWVFTDKDGDGQADDKRVLFSGISGTQHDHGIHQFIFGPDGKLYFNFGNAGQQIKDADGKPIIDKAGNEVNNHRKPYQEGMVFRCNLDGSEFETLGWDFRNNWMVTVDSFGTLWQSDNDDDGNKGVRINYVMEYGNYGYKDEKTGASWQTKRTGMNPNLPWKHWHQNDPGVVPNLLHTGAGSPTGICKYEGDLLPKVFQNQLIHCDAGPNVVRAYALTDDGAGYSAEIVNILEGRRDRWFRPSDVKVAPDGSLIVADWYDPGVGGHNMQDMDRGRLFRVTPKDHSGYSVPKQDFGSIDGLIAALKSPNNATRYVAWQGLAAKGDAARGALTAMSKDSNPVYRARALWLLAKLDPAGAVAAAAGDKDDRIRCQALRMARESDKVDTLDVVAKLVGDSSPQVRRDCSIALRFDGSTKANELWAKLAAQYDGKDRWYLEALGIGSDLHADARFDAWMSLVGDKWNTPAGHEIVWRTRSGGAADYLVKILQDPNTPKDMNDHYMRAFDFLDGAAKDKALKSLLGL
ncbi:MAG: dehydrogenase [Phycisphaera sp.]|nr:dehydrogenase [Phycisphaera sp.]